MDTKEQEIYHVWKEGEKTPRPLRQETSDNQRQGDSISHREQGAVKRIRGK